MDSWNGNIDDLRHWIEDFDAECRVSDAETQRVIREADEVVEQGRRLQERLRRHSTPRFFGIGLIWGP